MAQARYRRRIVDLQDEIDEADRFNDVGRASAARAETEFLTHELGSAVGLGGRDRESGANAERARVAVTLRLKSTLQKIRQCHPALGAHLTLTIKTGRSCCYSPDPTHPIAWTF